MGQLLEKGGFTCDCRHDRGFITKDYGSMLRGPRTGESWRFNEHLVVVLRVMNKSRAGDLSLGALTAAGTFAVPKFQHF